jgi:hypothetical protein
MRFAARATQHRDESIALDLRQVFPEVTAMLVPNVFKLRESGLWVAGVGLVLPPLFELFRIRLAFSIGVDAGLTRVFNERSDLVQLCLPAGNIRDCQSAF